MMVSEYSEEERKTIEIIYSKEGFTAAIYEIIRMEEEKAKNGYVVPIIMAIRYLQVDEHEKALDWLERGYEVRDQRCLILPRISISRGPCSTIPALSPCWRK